jgi:AraC family transcriptional regulator of arabinose operon
MASRLETPYRLDSELMADEFRRGRSYKNWRPRGSGDWLLIYTAGGAGRITTAVGDFPTRPGECILYAPDDLQDYRTDPATGRWHLLWSHFVPKAAWHPWLRWPVNAAGVRSVALDRGEVRGSFVRAMQRAIRIVRRRPPNAEDFAANALEEALLWAHLAASRGDWMRIDPRVRKAMDYLAARVRQPFDLETVARHCGLSVSRLAHLFKAEAGASPQRFFEQQRMRQAAQLLRVTGLGIAEVAAEVGYDDPFYFSNRFRRHSGKSPTLYRRRIRPKSLRR